MCIAIYSWIIAIILTAPMYSAAFPYLSEHFWQDPAIVTCLAAQCGTEAKCDPEKRSRAACAIAHKAYEAARGQYRYRLTQDQCAPERAYHQAHTFLAQHEKHATLYTIFNMLSKLPTILDTEIMTTAERAALMELRDMCSPATVGVPYDPLPQPFRAPSAGLARALEQANERVIRARMQRLGPVWMPPRSPQLMNNQL